MLYILIGLIVALIAGFLLFTYGDGYDFRHFLMQLLGFLLLAASGISGLVYFWMGWGWFAAETKAQVINREYGTNYTQAEIFYASDVIDTIREIDRKRIEVNGDLLREKKDE